MGFSPAANLATRLSGNRDTSRWGEHATDIDALPVPIRPQTQTPIVPDQNGDFVGQVFKISTDPKSNIKHILIRVHAGKLTSDMSLKSEKETKAAD